MFWCLILWSFIAGFLGNAFGLGGGFIFNPAQINLGVSPPIAASTTMYMVVYTAASSVMLFLLYGKLNIPYTLWMAIFSGIGVMFGMYYMGKALKRYKRPSLVSFTVAITLVISTIFSSYMNVQMLLHKAFRGIDITQTENTC